MTQDNTQRLRILVVDDEPEARLLLVSALAADGHDLYEAADGYTALTMADESRAQVVLLDQMMPGLSGMDCLAPLLKAGPERLVLFVTGRDKAREAVAALQAGAVDYLVKPIDLDVLRHAIRRAGQHLAMVEENRMLRTELEQARPSAEFPTRDQRMKELLQKAVQAAPTEATVLITGESGTGKEVLARFIQKRSHRADRPFVIVNCSALSEQLLESELFGHVKGAFTGAYQDHQGYVEAAAGGTLFLDEIGDIAPSLQVKLLRVLEDRQFSRVGDTALRKAEFRLLTATNRDLDQLLRAGKLREDFYYRINVFRLHLPPLRDRPADILFLFTRFIRELTLRMGRRTLDDKPVVIPPEVRDALSRHTWPGNVRELRNLAERMVILNDDGDMDPAHLPEGLQALIGIHRQNGSATTSQLREARRQFEIRFLLEQLELNEGNMAATARQIGMHPVALRQKLAKLGIDARLLR